jgi:hypothetical protein
VNALRVHLHVPLGAIDLVRPLWATLEDRGFSDPVHPDLPLELPEKDPEDQPHHAVAGRSRDGSSALAFVAHDVFVVVVRLVAPHADAATEWTEGINADAVDGLLGEARLWISGGETPDLVIAGRDSRGVELDVTGPLPSIIDDCWINDDRRVGWVARYVVHAVKLRFEADLIRDEFPGLRELQAELTKSATSLIGVVDRLASRRISPAELVDAETKVAQVRRAAAELDLATAQVKDLADTVKIAGENIAANVPSGLTSPAIDADAELAQLTHRRATTEVRYMESTTRRADVAATLAEASIRRENDRLGRTATRLIALNGAVVSMVFSVFGVSQAVHGPNAIWLMAFVAALSVSLPVVALYWTDPRRWPVASALGLLTITAAGTAITTAVNL